MPSIVAQSNADFLSVPEEVARVDPAKVAPPPEEAVAPKKQYKMSIDEEVVFDLYCETL